MNIPHIYEAVTTALADESGASDSLLHVHAGMAVLLAVRVLTGRSLATPIPFAAVAVAALLNEVADRINHGAWPLARHGLGCREYGFLAARADGRATRQEIA
jgi:hypothetical protein